MTHAMHGPASLCPGCRITHVTVARVAFNTYALAVRDVNGTALATVDCLDPGEVRQVAALARAAHGIAATEGAAVNP